MKDIKIPKPIHRKKAVSNPHLLILIVGRIQRNKDFLKWLKEKQVNPVGRYIREYRLIDIAFMEEEADSLAQDLYGMGSFSHTKSLTKFPKLIKLMIKKVLKTAGYKRIKEIPQIDRHDVGRHKFLGSPLVFPIAIRTTGSFPDINQFFKNVKKPKKCYCDSCRKLDKALENGG